MILLTLKTLVNFKSKIINDLLNGAPQAQRNIKTFLNKINYKNIKRNLINETAETISKIRISKEAQKD